MNNKLLVPLVLVVIFTLSGCGTEQTNTVNDDKTQLEKQLSTQLDTLEKAKQVEDQVLEAAEQKRKAMEEQGI